MDEVRRGGFFQRRDVAMAIGKWKDAEMMKQDLEGNRDGIVLQ